jgi:enoyl-CoA hydratase/carnithine racemase
VSVLELHLPEFCDRLRFARGREELSVTSGIAAVVVDLVGIKRVDLSPASFAAAVEELTTVVIARRTEPHDVSIEPYADACDIVLAAEDTVTLDTLVESISDAPLAATTAAMLLRHSERRGVTEGLIAESMAYSLLQAGPEFASWRANRPDRVRPLEIGSAVLMERDEDQLRIVLARPHVHNAVSARLRDALVQALEVAVADPTIRSVELSGAGASFCSGGDLDEFGSFTDSAEAHVVRLTRHAGRLAHALQDRLTVRLHGAAMGAGIEISAFAGRVIAAPDTLIGLPELSLGLIPGAGGTVSLPRRIGRHRTALLALSGLRIDAPQALAWGLIDEIDASPVNR